MEDILVGLMSCVGQSLCRLTSCKFTELLYWVWLIDVLLMSIGVCHYRHVVECVTDDTHEGVLTCHCS